MNQKNLCQIFVTFQLQETHFEIILKKVMKMSCNLMTDGYNASHRSGVWAVGEAGGKAPSEPEKSAVSMRPGTATTVTDIIFRVPDRVAKAPFRWGKV